MANISLETEASRLFLFVYFERKASAYNLNAPAGSQSTVRPVLHFAQQTVYFAQPQPINSRVDNIFCRVPPLSPARSRL